MGVVLSAVAVPGMSLAYVVSADVGIAAVALQDTNWLTGLFGFNAFALISVYLMFFDGPKVLASHALWILGSTTAFAVQFGTGAQFDEVVFTAKTLAAVAPVVATPLGIQFGIWAMRNEANESVTDPLTGLLNRRGLHLHIGDLIRDNTTKDTHVAVTVVDLDRFKDINDTFGHTIGDEVLIRSARRIKSAVRGSALVARAGGEEFVIVDLAKPGHAERDTDRVRHAVAAPADHAITASVGVTSIALASFAAPGADPVALLDTIIAASRPCDVRRKAQWRQRNNPHTTRRPRRLNCERPTIRRNRTTESSTADVENAVTAPSQG